MAYQKFETPVFVSSLYYYDSDYFPDTAERIFAVLDKHSFSSPDKLYAEKLTNNRSIAARSNSLELFVKAYEEKGVLGVEMFKAGQMSGKTATEFWKVVLSLTYLKNYPVISEKSFKPWNVLSIYSTHTRLNERQNYKDFIDCTKNLINVVEPFYASIDDVSNKVTLMDEAHVPCFRPYERVPLFWGNYLSRGYFDKNVEEIFPLIQSSDKELIKDGIYFSLSDSIFDYDSTKLQLCRKKVMSEIDKVLK